MHANNLRWLLVTAILTEGTSAALAQQPASDRPAVLEEIVVTAQKRDESLQDVPISMQVVTGNAISNMEMSDLSVMAQQLPNVSMNMGTVSNNIYMRGVGSGGNGGFEQSVGTFIDGVYRGRSRLSQSLLVDIERVEVLRGPQSIYFGNNSIAGAFSVTTRRPGDTLEGYAKASYEFEGEEPAVEAAVGGPLTDSVGFRIVGRYSDLDGYLKNQNTGNNEPQIKNEFVRGWLDWDISENWQTSLKAEYSEQKSKAPYAAQLVGCPPKEPFAASSACLVAMATGTETRFNDTRSSIPGEQGKLDGSEFVWNVDGTLSNGIGIASTLAYSEYDYSISADTSGIPIPFFQYSAPEDYDQTSLELRLTSPDDSRLGYIFGAYFLDSNLKLDDYLVFSLLDSVIPVAAPVLNPYLPLGNAIKLDQQEDQQSVFGAVTWSFTESLSVTAGVRWIDSQKDATQSATNVTATNPFGGSDGTEVPDALQPLAGAFTATTQHKTKASVSDNDTLPSLTIRYAPSDAVSYYATASQGFKAGGFDAVELTGIPDNLTYGPETVDAYEVGLKSLLFDNTLSLNLAVFRNDYDDLQQSATQYTDTAAYISVTNVGGLRSQGVELDSTWQINEEWQLTANAAYLDAEYEDYENAGCSSLQSYYQPEGCVQDLSGKAPPFSPKYSGSLGLSYDTSITDTLDFSGNLIMSFSDDYFLDATRDEGLYQDGWQTYDLRLAISDATKTWEVAAISRNITDEKIHTNGNAAIATPGSYAVTIQRGRTVFLQGRYNW